MQLTRHTDYALRILMYLGARTNRLASVAEIANYYDISRNHLVKVVQGLNEHGFVKTIRGKNGGMQLADDPVNISIGHVVRKMENHFDIVECFDDNAETCPLEDACRLKAVISRAANNFLKELDETTLADVLKPRLRKQLVSFTNNPSLSH